MSLHTLDTVATHIVQVSLMFRPNTDHLLGCLHVWRKGGLFGSADELLKFCPKNGCPGFFKDSAFELTPEERELIGEDGMSDPRRWPRSASERLMRWHTLPVFCPVCGMRGVREELPDSYGFSMPAHRVATRMADLFRLCSHDADIYLVRTKEDGIFHKARRLLYSEESRKFARYRDLLEVARDRDCVFYPLKSILKDTSSGGNLEKRFEALLEA